MSGADGGVRAGRIAGLDTSVAHPVEPGLVQVHQWRPDPGDFAPEGVFSNHGAVGRKSGA